MKTSNILVEKFFNSFDGKNGNTINPLPKQEELKLFRRWKRKKDKAALDKLLLHNLKFVVKRANRFKHHADGKAIDVSDLIQAGNEGLMEAINLFDPKRNMRFVTYAVHWIDAYIQNFVYANVSTVRVSLNNKTKVLINHRWTAFNLLNGKDADARKTWREKFKKKHQISEQSMQNEEMKIQTVGSIYSLDKDITTIQDGKNSLHNRLGDVQSDTYQFVENKNEQEMIKKKVRWALKLLPTRDREILEQRYAIDKLDRDVEPVTLQEVGNKHGISRERVRQLEVVALSRLKEKLLKNRAIREIIGVSAC